MVLTELSCTLVKFSSKLKSICKSVLFSSKQSTTFLLSLLVLEVLNTYSWSFLTALFKHKYRRRTSTLPQLDTVIFWIENEIMRDSVGNEWSHNMFLQVTKMGKDEVKSILLTFWKGVSYIDIKYRRMTYLIFNKLFAQPKVC